MKEKAELSLITEDLADHEEDLEQQEERLEEEGLPLRVPGFGLGQIKFEGVKGQILYRGDTRHFAEIFNEGFKARGTNRNLGTHIIGIGGDSAYISTSLSKEVAGSFPLHLFEYGNHKTYHYLYLIHSARKAIDIPKEVLERGINIAEEFAKHGRYGHNHERAFEVMAGQQERAFFAKIRNSEIKGCWLMEVTKTRVEFPIEFSDSDIHGEHPTERYHLYEYERKPTGQFISNPSYKPPGTAIWRNAHLLGKTLSWIAITLDAASLHEEYQQSMRTGEFHNTEREVNRIGGGWTAALGTGALCAEQAFIYGAVLSPLGQTTFAAAAGLTGSALGYYGGSNFAVELFELLNPKAPEVYESREIIKEEGLICSVTKYKDGSRVGRCFVSGNLATAKAEKNQAETRASEKDKEENQKEAKETEKNLHVKTVVLQRAAISTDLYLTMLQTQTAPAAPTSAYQEAIHDSGIAKIPANLTRSGAQSSYPAARSELAVASPALASQRTATSADLYLTMLQTQTAPASAHQEAIYGSAIARVAASSRGSEGHSIFSPARSEPAVLQASTERLLDNLKGLRSSQYDSRAYFALGNAGLSQFTGYKPTTHYFSSQAQADYWNTFASGYGSFEKTPEPVYSVWGGSSFFGGGGDRGGKSYCDPRSGNCYGSGGGGSCRDSSSDRCSSSLFK